MTRNFVAILVLLFWTLDVSAGLVYGRQGLNQFKRERNGMIDSSKNQQDKSKSKQYQKFTPWRTQAEKEMLDRLKEYEFEEGDKLSETYNFPVPNTVSSKPDSFDSDSGPKIATFFAAPPSSPNLLTPKNTTDTTVNDSSAIRASTEQYAPQIVSNSYTSNLSSTINRGSLDLQKENLENERGREYTWPVEAMNLFLEFQEIENAEAAALKGIERRLNVKEKPLLDNTKIKKVITNEKNNEDESYWSDVPKLEWNISPRYAPLAKAFTKSWKSLHPYIFVEGYFAPDEIYYLKENITFKSELNKIKFKVSRSNSAPNDLYYPFKGVKTLNITCNSIRHFGAQYINPEVKCEIETHSRAFNCRDEIQLGADFKNLMSSIGSVVENPGKITAACVKSDSSGMTWIMKEEKESGANTTRLEIKEKEGVYTLVSRLEQDDEGFVFIQNFNTTKLWNDALVAGIDFHFNGLEDLQPTIYKIAELYSGWERHVDFGREFRLYIRVLKTLNARDPATGLILTKNDSNITMGCLAFVNDLIPIPVRDPGEFIFISTVRDKVKLSCERIPRKSDALSSLRMDFTPYVNIPVLEKPIILPAPSVGQVPTGPATSSTSSGQGTTPNPPV